MEAITQCQWINPHLCGQIVNIDNLHQIINPHYNAYLSVISSKSVNGVWYKFYYYKAEQFSNKYEWPMQPGCQPYWQKLWPSVSPHRGLSNLAKLSNHWLKILGVISNPSINGTTTTNNLSYFSIRRCITSEWNQWMTHSKLIETV